MRKLKLNITSPKTVLFCDITKTKKREFIIMKNDILVPLEDAEQAIHEAFVAGYHSGKWDSKSVYLNRSVRGIDKHFEEYKKE